jgi:hypothetical protein
LHLASFSVQYATLALPFAGFYDIASSLWLDASRRLQDRLQDGYYFASSLLRDLVAVACEQYMPLVLLQEDATPVAAPTKPLTVYMHVEGHSV